MDATVAEIRNAKECGFEASHRNAFNLYRRTGARIKESPHFSPLNREENIAQDRLTNEVRAGLIWIFIF